MHALRQEDDAAHNALLLLAMRQMHKEFFKHLCGKSVHQSRQQAILIWQKEIQDDNQKCQLNQAVILKDEAV